MKRLAFLLLTLTLLPWLSATAQEKEYMYEIGVGGGMSWGYGDLNHSRAIYDPGLALQLASRYNVNLRWAVAADLSSFALKGDSRDGNDLLPNGTAIDFDRRLWQLTFRPEFHFWNYGWGNDYREKRRMTPFLTAGIGFGLGSGKVSGQKTDSHFCLSTPLGLGMKWKMAPRWNAQLTCLFTKLWNDEADGVSDLYGITTDALMKNDWCGSLMLSITFDFKERCIECHNQNSY